MELFKALKILVFNFTFMGKKSQYWYQGHLSHLRTTIILLNLVDETVLNLKQGQAFHAPRTLHLLMSERKK